MSGSANSDVRRAKELSKNGYISGQTAEQRETTFTAAQADVNVARQNLTTAQAVADERAAQLADHGIHARVYTNQGPKGPALKKIIEEFRPSRTVFIDDIAQHHASAAADTPETIRLHLCGEPLIAPHIDCAHLAGHAHARIDRWDKALPWLLERLHEEDR